VVFEVRANFALHLKKRTNCFKLHQSYYTVEEWIASLTASSDAWTHTTACVCQACRPRTMLIVPRTLRWFYLMTCGYMYLCCGIATKAWGSPGQASSEVEGEVIIISFYKSALHFFSVELLGQTFCYIRSPLSNPLS